MRRLTMRRWALIALACLATASAAAGLAWREAQQRYAAPGPLPADGALVIPRGSHVDIARTLQAAQVIGSADEFRLAAALTAAAGPLRAAEFMFPAHASLRDTLIILRTARPLQHRITLPEGLTAAQIATLLDREEALSGETPIPGEGELLPDTYSFERGTPRSAIAERAATAMRRTLARIWAERNPAIPLKSSQDLVTLASIVERETSRPDERGHIAAVFYNRLHRNMRLQSDPTVIYAATGGTLTGGHTITRTALTNFGDTRREASESDEGDEKAATGQMGRKHTVAYGLYQTHIFLSPFLAKDTGFTNGDLLLLIEALGQMFELDHSASRGEMSAHALYAFEHSSALGNAPSHKLFETITVASDPTAREFKQSRISAPNDGEEVKPGVHCWHLF